MKTVKSVSLAVLSAVLCIVFVLATSQETVIPSETLSSGASYQAQVIWEDE